MGCTPPQEPGPAPGGRARPDDSPRAGTPHPPSPNHQHRNENSTSKATIQIEGFTSKDPETREVTGHSITTVTVPVTPQKKNQQGVWEDNGDTVWYQAEFWDDHGYAVAEQIRKGQLVVVSGELEVKAWEANGKSGTNTIIKFPTISVIVRKPPRGQQGQNRAASAPADEPWSGAGQGASTPQVRAQGGDVWNTPGSFSDESPF